jgi:hypothetical protein
MKNFTKRRSIRDEQERACEMTSKNALEASDRYYEKPDTSDNSSQRASSLVARQIARNESSVGAYELDSSVTIDDQDSVVNGTDNQPSPITPNTVKSPDPPLVDSLHRKVENASSTTLEAKEKFPGGPQATSLTRTETQRAAAEALRQYYSNGPLWSTGTHTSQKRGPSATIPDIEIGESIKHICGTVSEFSASELTLPGKNNRRSANTSPTSVRYLKDNAAATISWRQTSVSLSPAIPQAFSGRSSSTVETQFRPPPSHQPAAPSRESFRRIKKPFSESFPKRKYVDPTPTASSFVPESTYRVPEPMMQVAPNTERSPEYKGAGATIRNPLNVQSHKYEPSRFSNEFYQKNAGRAKPSEVPGSPIQISSQPDIPSPPPVAGSEEAQLRNVRNRLRGSDESDLIRCLKALMNLDACLSDLHLDILGHLSDIPENVFVVKAATVTSRPVQDISETHLQFANPNYRWYVVPIQMALHWTVVMLDKVGRTYQHFDSLGENAFTSHKKKVVELMERLEAPASSWKAMVSICQVQKDKINCGMFTAWNIRVWVHGLVDANGKKAISMHGLTPEYMRHSCATALIQKYSQYHRIYHGMLDNFEDENWTHITKGKQGTRLRERQLPHAINIGTDLGMRAICDLESHLNSGTQFVYVEDECEPSSSPLVVTSLGPGMSWDDQLESDRDSPLTIRGRGFERNGSRFGGFKTEQYQPVVESSISEDEVNSRSPVTKLRLQPKQGDGNRGTKKLLPQLPSSFQPILQYPSSSVVCAATPDELPETTSRLLHKAKFRVILILFRSSPGSEKLEDDLVKEARETADEIRKIVGDQTIHHEWCYLSGQPATGELPSVGNMWNRNTKRNVEFVQQTWTIPAGESALMVVKGVEGASIQPKALVNFLYSTRHVRWIFAFDEQLDKELKNRDLWVRSRFAQYLFVSGTDISKEFNGGIGSLESRELFELMVESRESRVALVKSKTRGRNGNRREQKIRILLGRLKCPACTKTWYNTDAGKAAFIKHALNEHKYEAKGANSVCGVPGCTYMFSPTSPEDAGWKHIDTHVAVLGKEYSLKDHVCRIRGTSSINKIDYPFSCPVIGCPKARRAYNTKRALDIHIALAHPKLWDEKLAKIDTLKVDGSSLMEDWSQIITPVINAGEDREIDEILANECGESPMDFTSSIIDIADKAMTVRMSRRKRSYVDSDDEDIEEDLFPEPTKKQRGSKRTW